MKQKLTSFDIKVLVADLIKKLAGFRVINVYDINNKTFLIKLSRGEEKQVLLLESGIRLHTTIFQWPKNLMPSGFSMKLRKHLKGRRLESAVQVGVDRVVDLQFGSGEAAYHILLELYDRGNLALTDHQYTILNILRPRTNKDNERFYVRETYNINNAIQHTGMISRERVLQVLQSAKEGDNFKKTLAPLLVYSNQLMEHSLAEVSLKVNSRLGKEFVVERDLDKLMEALKIAEDIFSSHHVNGYIIQVEDKVAKKQDEGEDASNLIYSEFHPILFNQYKHSPHLHFHSFDQAVDEFFSKVETQKQERAVSKMENTVIRKLDLIRSDHFKRIQALSKEQLQDRVKARLIEMNLQKVESAMRVIRTALARQVSWEELRRGLAEAEKAAEGAVVEGVQDIKALKFESNQITMLLSPDYVNDDDDGEDEAQGGDDDDAENGDEVEAALKSTLVDIDLSLSAYANACKYYDKRKMAASKESKTTEASTKALKSAERKTYKLLKEAQSVNIINKARKSHWFEKFLWFISSENYMVIGGRDQQQNEFIVKKYLDQGDIYVHADLHGASSVVIKNPSNKPVSPVTLNEAGCMALCYSAAWDARVVTTCWWVHQHQVSKTAPSGEYLTTGSFMIRGKKNYLLPSLLVYGFGLLFKVSEASVERHRNERRVREVEEDGGVMARNEIVEVDEKNGKEEDEEDEDDEGRQEFERIDANNDEEEFIVRAPVARLKQNHDKKIKKKITSGKMAVVTSKVDELKVEEGDFPDTEIKYDLEGRGMMRGGGEANEAMRDNKSDGKRQCNQPLKRGQKGKLKKIKEKYGDQDEEEKAIRMSLLNSAGKKSEEKAEGKKGKKGKKNGNNKVQTNNMSHNNQGKGNTHKTNNVANHSKTDAVKGVSDDQKTVENKKESGLSNELKDQVVVEVEEESKRNVVTFGGEEVIVLSEKAPTEGDNNTEVVGEEAKAAEVEEEEEEEEDNAEADFKDETLKTSELLDSFTGVPTEEDELLYCLSVCAPYSTLTNYKYKMKMVPGNCKRGKAAKTFISIFLHEKNITPVEKNHLKSLKDMDISRNMPGKIKAPHMKKK